MVILRQGNESKDARPPCLQERSKLRPRKRVNFSDPLLEISEAAPDEATWDLTHDEAEQGQIVAPNIF